MSDSDAASLPDGLRPPCPRGCVDVEGCGCDWNQRREAWPGDPPAATEPYIVSDERLAEIRAMLDGHEPARNAGRFTLAAAVYDLLAERDERVV